MLHQVIAPLDCVANRFHDRKPCFRNRGIVCHLRGPFLPASIAGTGQKQRCFRSGWPHASANPYSGHHIPLPDIRGQLANIGKAAPIFGAIVDHRKGLNRSRRRHFPYKIGIAENCFGGALPVSVLPVVAAEDRVQRKFTTMRPHGTLIGHLAAMRSSQIER